MTDVEACAQLYRDLCDASMRKDADGIAMDRMVDAFLEAGFNYYFGMAK